MNFRLAEARDLDAIAGIYEAIHDAEEDGRMVIGWVRGVYPTRDTARAAIELGDMYVAEVEGKVVAAARINAEQVPEYANARWSVEARDEEVLVLHTLVVAPEAAGRGIGSEFVRFYERLARAAGRRHLRMDTNERNVVARRMYKRLGYFEADVVDCCFNGIPGVRLVCLEKNL